MPTFFEATTPIQFLTGQRTPQSNKSTIGTCEPPTTSRSGQINTGTKQHRSIRSPEKTKTRTPAKERRFEVKKKIWRKVMARFFVLLSFVVAVFAQSSLARGGIQERLERMQERQHTENNEEEQDFNENLDQLVGALKTNGLKDLCESGKVSRTWCQYKELLELNAAYVQQQKSVKKKSACWPGLPWPCDKRLTRAVHSHDTDKYDEMSDDDDKRALKCRPGMVNCRNRKKGKRTLQKAPPKTKDCPQGWMYCL